MQSRSGRLSWFNDKQWLNQTWKSQSCPLIRVYRAFMVGRWRWHVFLRNTCSLYLIDWWDLSIEWWYNEMMQYTTSIGKDWTINQTNWFHQWISTVSWDFLNLGGTPRPILQSSNTVDICLNVKKLLGHVGTLMNLQVECLNRGWHGTSWYLWRQGLQHLPTPQISDPSWRTVVFVVMIKVELQLVG